MRDEWINERAEWMDEWCAKILRSFALSFDNKCMAAATDVLAVVVKLNELKLKGKEKQ